MLAGGLKSSELLDELESHLREDTERQVKSGIDPRAAFETAVERVGHADALKAEFKKAAKLREPLLMKIMLLFGRHRGLPLPDFNTFTEHAQLSLGFAREEAPRLHHDYIGTEHVLLGLLRMEDGAVRRVLGKLGVEHVIVRREIERLVGVGPDVPGKADAPFTPRARMALELAGDEARALRHTRVGSAHILLGLLREGGGVAAIILKKLGVQIDQTRSEILKELATGQGNN